MKSIREEIQEWLELVTRGVKGLPFDLEVEWWDIEDVYNGNHCDAETPSFITSSGEELSFETVYCDAIAIDHMCSEIMNSDFLMVIKLMERYRGVKIISHNDNFIKNAEKFSED